MMRPLSTLSFVLTVAIAWTHSQAQEKSNAWKPWLADFDASDPGDKPGPALTAEYFPHKPGTTRKETLTFFDDDGKPTSITERQCEHRDEGVIASRIIRVGAVRVLSGNVFPESTQTYEIKDAFVRIGYPSDRDLPDSPTKWFQILMVGAKPGDRWSSVPGTTELEKQYKAAGTYEGKSCIVIVEKSSYTIFVEGFGEALSRHYTLKDGKWLLSMEREYK